MAKAKFKKEQARQIAVIFLGLSLFVFGVGLIIGDTPVHWGVFMTLFFTISSYFIGGYYDPNDTCD